LVTSDGGKSWKAAAIGASYVAGPDAVYWWTTNTLFLASPSLRTSTRIARSDDTIVSGALVKGGMVALVDRPGKAPNVIVVQGTTARTVSLPARPAELGRSDDRGIRLRGRRPRRLRSGSDRRAGRRRLELPRRRPDLDATVIESAGGSRHS